MPPNIKVVHATTILDSLGLAHSWSSRFPDIFTYGVREDVGMISAIASVLYGKIIDDFANPMGQICRIIHCPSSYLMGIHYCRHHAANSHPDRVLRRITERDVLLFNAGVRHGVALFFWLKDQTITLEHALDLADEYFEKTPTMQEKLEKTKKRNSPEEKAARQKKHQELLQKQAEDKKLREEFSKANKEAKQFGNIEPVKPNVHGRLPRTLTIMAVIRTGAMTYQHLVLKHYSLNEYANSEMLFSTPHIRNYLREIMLERLSVWQKEHEDPEAEYVGVMVGQGPSSKHYILVRIGAEMEVVTEAK